MMQAIAQLAGKYTPWRDRVQKKKRLGVVRCIWDGELGDFCLVLLQYELQVYYLKERRDCIIGWISELCGPVLCNKAGILGLSLV